MAAGFVAGLLSAVSRRGIAPRELLAEAGIDPGVLGGRDGRVPVGAYAALYNLTVRRLGDEAFGLLPQALQPGAFEFLCRATMGSTTLGEALDRASRYLAVVMPSLRLAVAASDEHAILAIGECGRPWARSNDPRRVFAYEWLLRLVHALACWLVARPLPLDSVAFPYRAPAHAADYALVYTERATFGAPRLEARFDSRLLALPVLRDQGDLPAFLEGAPGRISLLYRRDREAARAVRDHLREILPHAGSLAGAARALHVSPRSLHRRLRDEGTSFREVREALRREIALARVERTADSIASIATDLGYSEPSAFFRAFVGWTGHAPSHHRRRHRHQQDASVKSVW